MGFLAPSTFVEGIECWAARWEPVHGEFLQSWKAALTNNMGDLAGSTAAIIREE
jgi:hypothetical protein